MTGETDHEDDKVAAAAAAAKKKGRKRGRTPNADKQSPPPPTNGRGTRGRSRLQTQTNSIGGANGKQRQKDREMMKNYIQVIAVQGQIEKLSTEGKKGFFQFIQINLCLSCTYTKFVMKMVVLQVKIVIHSVHSVLGVGTYRIVVYVRNRRKNKYSNDNNKDGWEMGALYVVPVHKHITSYI